MPARNGAKPDADAEAAEAAAPAGGAGREA